MSTKHIEVALLSHGVTHDVTTAMKELEAIRRAVQHVVTNSMCRRGSEYAEWDSAMDVLRAIAKEADNER